MDLAMGASLGTLRNRLLTILIQAQFHTDITNNIHEAPTSAMSRFFGLFKQYEALQSSDEGIGSEGRARTNEVLGMMNRIWLEANIQGPACDTTANAIGWTYLTGQFSHYVGRAEQSRNHFDSLVIQMEDGTYFPDLRCRFEGVWDHLFFKYMKNTFATELDKRSILNTQPVNKSQIPPSPGPWLDSVIARWNLRVGYERKMIAQPVPTNPPLKSSTDSSTGPLSTGAVEDGEGDGGGTTSNTSEGNKVNRLSSSSNDPSGSRSGLKPQASVEKNSKTNTGKGKGAPPLGPGSKRDRDEGQEENGRKRKNINYKELAGGSGKKRRKTKPKKKPLALLPKPANVTAFSVQRSVAPPHVYALEPLVFPHFKSSDTLSVPFRKLVSFLPMHTIMINLLTQIAPVENRPILRLFKFSKQVLLNDKIIVEPAEVNLHVWPSMVSLHSLTRRLSETFSKVAPLDKIAHLLDHAKPAHADPPSGDQFIRMFTQTEWSGLSETSKRAVFKDHCVLIKHADVKGLASPFPLITGFTSVEDGWKKYFDIQYPNEIHGMCTVIDQKASFC